MNEKIYLCGPVQHADDHGVGWREDVKAEYPDFEWVDPLDSYLHGEGDIEKEWTDEEIVRKDLELIVESDALLVNWTRITYEFLTGDPHYGVHQDEDGHLLNTLGVEPTSAGTPMEVFFTGWMNQTSWLFEDTVTGYNISSGVYNTEPRWIGELLVNYGAKKPIVVVFDGDEISPWMSRWADSVVSSMDLAVEVLKGLLLHGDVQSEESDVEYDYQRDIEEIQSEKSAVAPDGGGSTADWDPIGNEYSGDTESFTVPEKTSEQNEILRRVPEEAAETVTQKRDSHGEALENHDQIAEFWSTHLREKLSENITGREVAEMMQLLKLSRASTGVPEEDHYVDICGYATIANLWAEVNER